MIPHLITSIASHVLLQFGQMIRYLETWKVLKLVNVSAIPI